MTSSGSTSAATGGKLLIKPSKAGRQTDPGTAPHRAAVPAREQRPGGDQTAQPDHPRLGRLLPDTGIRRDRSASWTNTCGGSHGSGPGPATRTSRRLGRSPGTSASSTRPGRTGGCSVTAHSGAYLHRFAWTNIVRHEIVKHRASPDDPAARRLLGQATAQSAPADQPHEPIGSTRSRTAAARSAGQRSSPSRTGHKPRSEWETWLATTRKTIDIVWDQATPDKAGPPRLIHLHCQPHAAQPPRLA